MSNFFADTITHDPRIDTTERISDILLLEPITRDLVQSITNGASAHGIEFMVFETFRSKARQKALFDQGTNKLLNVGVHYYSWAKEKFEDSENTL